MSYICGHLNDVRVADVTDPIHPILSEPLNMMALDIAFWGTTAFAASEFGGLNVYDMSDPADPQYLNGTTPDNVDIRAYAVAVPRGDYAYMANYTVFSVVDAHDFPYLDEISAYESGGWADSIAAEGRMAYVSFGLAGIKILDFSDPSRPRELSRFHTHGQAFGLLKEGDLLYVADNPFLTIYDVSNPSEPVEVSHIRTGSIPAKLAKKGDFVYIMFYDYGLIVVSVADPRNPVAVGQLYTGTDVSDIAIEGAYLYMTDYDSGLIVIDISQPEAPRMIWSEGNAKALSLAIDNKKAYIANWDRYFRIFDISDAESPKLIANADVSGRIFKPVIRDGLAFAPYSVQEGDERIIVLDISNADNIKVTGYTFTMYIFGLALTPEYIFGKYHHVGVAAFDISSCVFNGHVRPVSPP